MMTLHFDLKDMFFLCIVLMMWHLLLPWTGVLAAVYFLGTLAYLRYKKILTAVDVIFAAAFGLNLWYVLGSWGNVRQYDYFNFLMHADYFLQHDFFVAAPLAYLQMVYFQPPLWGLISAVTVWICQRLAGADLAAGFDSVRMISLFCVAGAGVIFWRLLVALEIKPQLRAGLFALFCFFPAHGIAANLVNNDTAVYFLMTAMMWVGYRWYVSGAWRDALVLSGLLTAAGLIKFSGLMIVPALGMLGLFRLAQAENKLEPKMWAQFAIIGIGAGVGFAWGWFLLAFDFPLVPPPVGNAYQDLSRYSLSERLFGLMSAGEVFADVRGGGAEPNVWLALVKTALFGEWRWQGEVWAYILYAAGVILALWTVVGFFALPFYRLGKGWGFNAFALVLTFSVLAAWIGFWTAYPYFCSSEYRYVMILLPVSLLWAGNFWAQKKLPQVVECLPAVLAIVFAVARFMLYLNTI